MATESRRSVRATATLTVIALLVVALVALATAVAVRDGTSNNRSSKQAVHGELALGQEALGTPAPLFDLPNLEGAGEVHLADYRGGVVIVNFWRSDCIPCRDEFALLRQTSEKRDVTVVGVSLDSIPSDARRFVADERARWAQALDQGRAVAKAYGVGSWPQTFFIRSDGGVAYRVYGQLRPSLIAEGIEAAKAGRGA